MMRKIERENTGLLQAGQDLVVAGYAGLAGTVKLAEAAKEELSRWFSDEYMEEIADAAPLVCRTHQHQSADHVGAYPKTHRPPANGQRYFRKV